MRGICRFSMTTRGAEIVFGDEGTEELDVAPPRYIVSSSSLTSSGILSRLPRIESTYASHCLTMRSHSANALPAYLHFECSEGSRTGSRTGSREGCERMRSRA